MTLQTEKRPWLLALDGSDDAFETVRYVAGIRSIHDRPMVLFAVTSRIPNVYWDLEKEPVYNRKLGEIRAWESQRIKTLETYMAKAREVFVTAGFAPEQIETRLHEREEGIARDIIRECGKGYAAIVVGRKGTDRLREVLLGSVATKLLERVAAMPVVLVGRDVRQGKVLVAFDGSQGSLKGVDWVGSVFGASGYDISLTNVMRYEEKDQIAKSERFIAEAFERAMDRLIAAGVSRDRITTQIVTGATSRAASLVKEAAQGGYGTIVMGRRGLSEVRDFSMGTVTNKVVQLATKHAVWVVG